MTATASGPRALTFLFLAFAALVAAFAFSGPASAAEDAGAQPPSISSDKIDYAPGELVTLRGSNWQPGETVNVDVNDDQTQTWRRNVDVTADADGKIIDTFNLPDWFVATYTVKATGVSGVAMTSFTDANMKVYPGPSSSGVQFTLTVQGFTNNTCTNGAGATQTQLISNGTGGENVSLTGSSVLSESSYVKLMAASAASSPSGWTFKEWSTGPGSSTSVTTTTNAAICVAKPAGGTNDSYRATYQAPAATQNQTITFNQPASPAAYNSTFAVTSTASSGLPVSVSASGVCTIAGGIVTMTSGTGICTLTASQAGDAQFNAASNVVRMVDASKLNQTITFGALANKTFGNPDFSVGATASSGLTVGFSALGDCNLGVTGVHITAAGSCTITAAQAGNDNYNAATAVPQAFTIAKASATLALSNLSHTYDGLAKSATVTTSPSGLPGASVTYDGSATAPTNAGSYPVVASLENPNYTASSVNGTLEIGKASQTVTFGALATKTFGDAPFTLAASASSGLAPGYEVKAGSNSKCTVSSSEVTITGAGSCTLVATQAGNGNFNAAPSVEQNFTIGKAEATLTLSNLSATYDGTAKPVTVTTSPAGLSGVSVTYAGSATAPKNAGSYAVVASLTNDNYEATNETGTLVISPKSITGFLTAGNKVYDGNDSATVLTRSLNGEVSGDAVSLSGGTASFANENVGNGKTVTLAGGSLAGADAGNYTLASVGSTTANITPKSITGSFESADKVYDGNTAAAATDRALLGTVAGDAVSLSGGTASFADKNVGVGKVVTLSGASLAGADKDNYILSSVSTETADITAKSITGNFTTPASRAYDGTTSAVVSGRSLNDTVAGDAVSLAGGTASFADKNVGVGKVVTLSGASLAGADKDNYILSSVSTETADITAKSIAGSFTASHKVYDGTVSATIATRSLTGQVSGDTVSLTGGSASFGDRNVGNGKTVTLVDASLAGADAGNYTLASVGSTTANITPKSITGSFESADKVYDGNTAAAATDRALLGTVAGDAVSLSGGTASFADKNVGVGKVVTLSGASLAGADKDNYILSSVSTETADITAKSITGSFTASHKVYDGTVSATIATRSLTGQVSGDTVSLTGGTATFMNKNVGTDKAVTATGFTLAGTDAGNYELVAGPWTAEANITPKQITGAFTAANKILDGTTAATIVTRSLDNVVSGDAVSLNGGTATFDNANVGQNKTVTGTGFTISGGDSGNYTLASSTLTTTASITYAWSGFLQPINDTAHQTGLSQSKFKLGQTIPAKFELRDAAGNIVQQTGNPTFTRTGNRGTCEAGAAFETITDPLAPDGDAQYKLSGGHYQYGWSTKGLTAGVYRIYANLADGTKPWVDICLTK